jgi:hypothetical protein
MEKYDYIQITSIEKKGYLVAATVRETLAVSK